MNLPRPTRRRMRIHATATVRDDSMLTAEGRAAMADRVQAQVVAVQAKIADMPEGSERTAFIIMLAALTTKRDELDSASTRQGPVPITTERL